jgi:hypothetical protein
MPVSQRQGGTINAQNKKGNNLQQMEQRGLKSKNAKEVKEQK